MAAQISENKFRQIVREEIDGSKEISGIKGELRKQGALVEEAISRFDRNIDLLTAQMDVKNQVDDHEERIGELETGQKLLKSAVEAK